MLVLRQALSAATVRGMLPTQKIVASAAASLFGRKLEHINPADLVLPDLSPADRDLLTCEQLRRHLAGELIVATLAGTSAFRLTQQFTIVDSRCPKPLLNPVQATPPHHQLTLVTVPSPAKARRRRTTAPTRAA